MNRKEWFQFSSVALATLLVGDKLWAKSMHKQLMYLMAQVKPASQLFDGNHTFPFDWSVSEIKPNGSSVSLSWEDKLQGNGSAYFRLTSATDIREECIIELSLANTKKIIGQLDIQYAHYMQPFELVMPADLLPLVIQEGITLKMIRGTKPFWFFTHANLKSDIPKEFLPHLLLADGNLNLHEWKNRLLSLASISTFGWMEGCVLDGISSLSKKHINAQEILNLHLDKYFANDTLVYENLNNKRSFEKITTVESILPFAILAATNAQHAMLQQAIDFCKTHTNAEGVIADETGNNRRLKTEECYTISYPLAILAQKFKQPELADLAIANLKARVSLLAKPNFIYQNAKEKGKPEYGNWARGVGWYLLGMAKSLAVLPNNEEAQPLRAELQRAAEFVIIHQQKNGLWSNFLHQAETGIDTSGSASIAAALAYGASKNLLPNLCKQAAYKSWKGLRAYLTPDGFLKGTAQVNKGGELLQRNGFRVISPYTLGFLGVLDNSLNN
ncbi:hypothetical protein EZ428_19225 [Pedobacter frigiditerrae]|uniref:Rhamnogalacturonyl hydrolase YesR n=1 Tax=Pedobacter frigiditerrae TaxID=2530452 RepID=A0A4R0MRW3_9SPHI|nr:glycoside hydrolase family 88 protein [Pedobacter frigiditerrae]TCC88764.1 hypothetical protein EZ428_19225 [Pedobacter frigiditerrae]